MHIKYICTKIESITYFEKIQLCFHCQKEVL